MKIKALGSCCRHEYGPEKRYRHQNI